MAVPLQYCVEARMWLGFSGSLTFPVSLVFTGYLLCALVTDQHLSFLLPYVVLGSHVGLASDVGSGAHDIW